MATTNQLVQKRSTAATSCVTTGVSTIDYVTTFRKQRNNERAEIARARRVAEGCARTNP
ncbi:MAG TPA: hypothetical protein PKD80_16610 [Microthrixaceae bacterium]|nr:hypothetical protein [Microthrixaceae bacterium]HMT25393.1 hypothetical protein [Microthrixaceae bacterium]HMT63031.1 hypothetical protein [Microthrixaceae bacterium]